MEGSIFTARFFKCGIIATWMVWLHLIKCGFNQNLVNQCRCRNPNAGPAGPTPVPPQIAPRSFAHLKSRTGQIIKNSMAPTRSLANSRWHSWIRFIACLTGMVASAIPQSTLAQSCRTVNQIGSLTPPTNVRQMFYSQTYGRLILKNLGSAVAVLNTSNGQAATRSPDTSFVDMALSPSGRYVFAADYGGENIGYGTPANGHSVHRLDLSNGTWERRSVFIAGGVQAVSDSQFILKSRDQWITFTNNSWGSGPEAVILNNTNSSYYSPGYYAWAYYGDFRYDPVSNRLLHGNSGLSSQEIQTYSLVNNNFVPQESSGTYGSAQGYGYNVALATDSSAFYYGNLQVDPLDVSFNRRVFADPIYVASGSVAFGNGRLFNALNGDLITPLGFDTTVYALNPSGDDFWAFDQSANLLRHFELNAAPCGIPLSPVGVRASVTQNTKNLVVSWGGVEGATSYNVYMARQQGVTKANYASLPGGVKFSSVTSPFTRMATPAGTHHIVVTAVNASGESEESTAISINVQDTDPPSVPTGLTAVALDHSRVNLNWNPSTDDAGVYRYEIYRGANYFLNTVYAPQTTYQDSSLSPQTQVTYQVRACDSSYNCSALSDSVAVTTPPRTAPNPFGFNGQYGVQRSVQIESNSISVTGIQAPAPISIMGGEYSINGGPYTAAPGMVSLDQTVMVRVISSASYATTVTATLTIGGVAGGFSVTTLQLNVISTPYFPMPPGATWTYVRNQVLGTASVAGTDTINGLSATGISDAMDSSVSYFSTGAQGVRLHRLQYPPGFVAGCGVVSETITYSAPVVVMPPNFTVGQQAYYNGAVSEDHGACGVFAYNYSSDTYFLAHEKVTVPAGQFDAAKIRLRVTITSANFTSTTFQTFWLAPGIGKVKEIDTLGNSRELVSTNVERTVPDEFAFVPQKDVVLRVPVISGPVTISGMTIATPISVMGGEYSIGNGEFTANPGVILNGQSVRVRVLSPDIAFTSATATLTIGGVAVPFTVTAGNSPLLAVKSRKIHGAVAHDVAVSHLVDLNGAITTEPRLPGAGHKIIFTFSVPIASPGIAAVVDGTGASLGMAHATINPADPNEVIVQLSGVEGPSRIKVSLTGVNGAHNVGASIGLLAGDVNNTRAVGASDIFGVKSRIGKEVGPGNFRADVNADGLIDAADLGVVKQRSGTRLP